MKPIQMPSVVKNLFRVLITICLWLAYLMAFSQLHQNENINFEVENQSIRRALDRLGEMAGLNFTYNAADPSFNRTIDYKAIDKPLSQVLEELLKRSGHDYKRIGNQLVVFVAEQTREETVAEPEYSPSRPAVPDTVHITSPPVVVYDTVVQFETITQTDTLVIRDTVFIKQPESAKVPAASIKRLSSDIFRFEPNREDGWALSFSYAQFYGGIHNTAGDAHAALLDKSNETESFSLRNYALGIGGLYNMNQWSFSAAVGLSGFSNRFRYEDVNSSGGYYQIDTISWYYTLPSADTIWFPVTDSSYLPLDFQETRYNQLNRVGFLDLQISAAYRFFFREAYHVYVKAGFGGAMPIYKDGVLLQNKENHPGIDFGEKNFADLLLFYEGGAAVSYYIADWFDLFAELTYKRYMTPLVSDYALDKRFHGGGLRIGLVYYF